MTYLPYIQIILSVILIALILLQHSDSGAGATFGGGDSMGSLTHTKRGPEKFIFIITIIIAILFAGSALVALVI